MTDEIPYWLILVGLFCLYEADYSLSSADLDDPFLQNRPLLQAPPYDGATLFETMTGEVTGLNFTHPFEDSHPLSFLYYASSTCGGIAIGDINQDQRPDIFLAGAARPSALYEQDRTWHFTETTQMRLPTHANAWSTGAAMVDVDQDGDLDIYVCQYDSPNLLFLNQGPNEPMVEAANDFGLNLTDACVMPALPATPSAQDKALLDAADALLEKVRQLIDRQAFHEALRDIWQVIADANRYVDAVAPWALRKTDPDRMNEVLAVLAETIRQVAILVQPVMPDAACRMLDQIGVPQDQRHFACLGESGRLAGGQVIGKPEPVFPRYVDDSE